MLAKRLNILLNELVKRRLNAYHSQADCWLIESPRTPRKRESFFSVWKQLISDMLQGYTDLSLSIIFNQ